MSINKLCIHFTACHILHHQFLNAISTVAPERSNSLFYSSIELGKVSQFLN